MMAHNDYDDSPEAIYDDLGDLLVGNDHDRTMVALTLSRIPQDVRCLVMDCVQFIQAGPASTSGTIARLRVKEPSEVYFVVLNFPESMTDEARQDTVAHEIAHIVAGHDRFGMNGNTARSDEVEADNLCESWGFNRVYACYDHLGPTASGHEKKPMAHDLVRRSAETGERISVGWDPVLAIGLKALGGDELDPGVYSGNDRDGRLWIVEMAKEEPKT